MPSNTDSNSSTRRDGAILPLIVSALVASTISAFATCACGPDFCQNDARIAAALSAKKKSLSGHGYPARLVSLLDVGDQCYARITRSPDIFTMLLVAPNGDKQTLPWSSDDESIAKADLASGKIKRYWIFNARNDFSCCGQKPYQQRPDYDSADDVNSSTAIKCELSQGKASCTK